MINWIEEQETPDKYWALKGEAFIIVSKQNAYELVYDMNVEGNIVRTIHRATNLECLKKLAEVVLNGLLQRQETETNDKT